MSVGRLSRQRLNRVLVERYEQRGLVPHRSIRLRRCSEVLQLSVRHLEVDPDAQAVRALPRRPPRYHRGG